MATRFSRFAKSTLIRMARTLDSDGRVLVHLGEHVASETVIADQQTGVSHRVVDVGRILGISRDIPTTDFVDWKVGEQIQKDDILAQRGNVLRGVVRSPVSGKVVAIGGGQVMIELESPRQDLMAGMPGLVRQIIPDRGVLLETSGALVEGAWGNERLGFGVLTVLENQLLVDAEAGDIALKDKIVVVGHLVDSAILQRLVNVGVAGVISGCASARLLEMISELKIPLMLVEGFGSANMNSVAYDVLKAMDGRPCYLLALAVDHKHGQRPSAIIQHKDEVAPAATDTGLAPGKTVRLIDPSRLGQVGTIIEIDPSAFIHYAGQVPAALVKLEDGALLQTPLENLVLIL